VSSLLWTTEGFTSGTPNTAFRSYDNDSGIWTAYSGWPNAQSATVTTVQRQAGAWDGTYWYIIGTDGKLYRMNGLTQVWSAALLGGVSPWSIGGATHNHGWVMTSDGRFVYILMDSNDFRRYDPVNNTLTVLPAPPLGGSLSSYLTFLAYDGIDTIYARGTDSGSNRQFLKFTISTGTWSSLITFSTGVSIDWVFGVCLQGKLWTISYSNGTSNYTPWVYDPVGPSWTIKTTKNDGGAGAFGGVPYGEETDGTIRFWRSAADSYIYNIGTNAWTVAAVAPINFTIRTGYNFAVTRLFTPAYTFFAADGVTSLGPDYLEGSAVVGQTITHQIKVQTPVDRGGGANVAVVSNVQTDAEEVVSISATSGGSYTSSFTTGALTAGQLFDVFIKVVPSSVQTSGVTKHWNLRVT
jgi:hypothetical protein